MKNLFLIIFILTIIFNKGFAQDKIEILLTVNKEFSNDFYEDKPLFVFINKIPETDLEITSTLKFSAFLKEDNVYKIFLNKSNQTITIRSSKYNEELNLKIDAKELKFKEVRVYEISFRDSISKMNAFQQKAILTQPTESNERIENSKWKGYYVCSQGKTELNLEIVSKDDALIAYFDFNYLNKVTGKYSMKGNYDKKNNSLSFTADAWIKQPAGYGMVNMIGKLYENNTIYKGNIIHTGCSEFYLEKVKNEPKTDNNTNKQIVYFYEDFSKIEEGLIPENWIGGKTLLVKPSIKIIGSNVLAPFQKGEHYFKIPNIVINNDFVFEIKLILNETCCDPYNLEIGNLKIVIHTNGNSLFDKTAFSIKTDYFNNKIFILKIEKKDFVFRLFIDDNQICIIRKEDFVFNNQFSFYTKMLFGIYSIEFYQRPD